MLSRTWEVDDLARVAYGAYGEAMRAAITARQEIAMPLFRELSPSLQEVWRHVAITVWNELWTNSAPPVSAAPVASEHFLPGDRQKVLAALLEKLREEKPKP